jgi:phage/plasmid primase-like uncharacterized protein
MSALLKIKNAGFDVVLYGDSFKIIPSSSLSAEQRVFLKSHKAEIISELQAEALTKTAAPFVSCGNCLYFKCNNEHGRGAGSCNAGGDYGLWSESLHQCTKFDAVIEYKDYVVNDDALTVICFTPNGKPIKVQASSGEHAEYLQRMNSKPKEIIK